MNSKISLLLTLTIILFFSCASQRNFVNYTLELQQRAAKQQKKATVLTKESKKLYANAKTLDDIFESLYLADQARLKDGNKKELAIIIAKATATIGQYLPHSEARPYLNLGRQQLEDNFYPLASNVPVEVPYFRGVILGLLAKRYGERLNKIQAELLELFSQTEKIDKKFLCAAANRELARLYFESPGWPLGLGDKEIAAKQAKMALKICPNFAENVLVNFELKIRSKGLTQKAACLAIEKERIEIIKKIDKLRGKFWRQAMKRYLEKLRNICKRER